MNIDNNIVLSEKTEESSPITVSIPDGADVIVGQHIYLVVTVKSPQVKSIKSISIEDPKKNISVLEVVEDWKLINDTSGKAIFMLGVDDKLSSNTIVSYTAHAYSNNNVDVQEIQPLIVSYTTKIIKKDSIVLLGTDIEVIEAPKTPNPIDDPNSKYIPYLGVMVDENNNPLKNTQVILSGSLLRNSLNYVNITTDPINDSPPELINIQIEKGFPKFFTVNSDANGNIRFRVYPIDNKGPDGSDGYSSTRIDFHTQIFGVINETYVASAYIVGTHSPYKNITPPRILGILPGGEVRKKIELKEFKVGINEYEYNNDGDAIVFLIKDKRNNIIQLKPTCYVEGDSSFGYYSFCLSYEKIPLNKRVDFYYLISAITGDAGYSKKLEVIFVDDSGTNPNNGGNTGNGNHCDNGLYNKVDVDSNYEDGKFSLKIKSITLI